MLFFSSEFHVFFIIIGQELTFIMYLKLNNYYRLETKYKYRLYLSYIFYRMKITSSVNFLDTLVCQVSPIDFLSFHFIYYYIQGEE